MQFTITLDKSPDAMGIDRVFRLFPSGTVEEVKNEIRDAEYTVTYKRDFDETWPTMPEKVALALVKAWPDQVDEIMKSMFHNHDHWAFNRWGMYVGVEYDGHIHT